MVKPILASTGTRELEKSEWLQWAQSAPDVQRMWAYRLAPGETALSSETSAQAVARVISQRYDSKDTQPFNYDCYAIVQASDGAFYHSGPHKNVDFGHHRSAPVSDVNLGVKP